MVSLDNFNMNYQRGQTLIETMVAVFILVMGITAALGLAVFSLNASSEINKQIIAIGLAREGVEAVKNMRDTNWLHDTLSENCHNFDSGQPSNTYCYRNWLGDPSSRDTYNIEPGPFVANMFVLNYDINDDKMWQLSLANEYGMNFEPEKIDNGFYTATGNTSLASATSDFARAITLEIDDFPPFDHAGDLGPRLKVTSQVWWKGRKCPANSTPPTGTQCSVTLETYLTNWRNY